MLYKMVPQKAPRKKIIVNTYTKQTTTTNIYIYIYIYIFFSNTTQLYIQAAKQYNIYNINAKRPGLAQAWSKPGGARPRAGPCAAPGLGRAWAGPGRAVLHSSCISRISWIYLFRLFHLLGVLFDIFLVDLPVAAPLKKMCLTGTK